MPGGTQEQLQKFAERQRKTTSAECAYRYFETTKNLDVSELLPKVTLPTLVMHKREDEVKAMTANRRTIGRKEAAGEDEQHLRLTFGHACERIHEIIRRMFELHRMKIKSQSLGRIFGCGERFRRVLIPQNS